MRIEEPAELAPHNTFGVAAQARCLVHLEQASDMAVLRRQSRWRDLPHLILGGGSNVLFVDDFPGLVVKVAFRGHAVVAEDAGAWYVSAAGGESWHAFVRWTLAQGMAGLENLSFIPGTVGAAPVQNIGAYGVELADLFHELKAMHLATGQMRSFDRTACRFAYRDSFFKSSQPGQWLITEVVFRLPKQPRLRLAYAGLRERLTEEKGPVDAHAVSEAVIALRRSKLPDPAQLGNAGSFFKNPVVDAGKMAGLVRQYPDLPGHPQADGRHKLSAAWLIDRCGWKGYREGDAGVSPEHALVLVNYGQASGRDIWSLACRIMASVQARFGIGLEPEPRIIGR